MRFCSIAVVIVFGLTACAPSPGGIAPAAVPAAMYSGLTCNAARAMRQGQQEQLSALEVAQRQAVAGDAIGVFLIAIPVSSLTGGNKAGAIAEAKGRLIALDARLAGC